MPELNLRDLYPDAYTEDFYVIVSDEILEAIRSHDRMEAAYRRRKYYHKAQYSLDRGDGIEYTALFDQITPQEICETKLIVQELHTAIAALPAKQARRVYAHFILGLTETEIAQREGVSIASVSESLRRGLKSLREKMKKFFM